MTKTLVSGQSGWNLVLLCMEKSRSALLLKRQRGSQSLMVWSCFSARAAPKLKIIDGNLNSKKYCGILADIMIPFRENAYNGE